MKRTVVIQDMHLVYNKPRHNQVLHVYHNWTDEELADEANVVRQNDIKFRRLKRFIESYDEIMEALRSAANELNEWDAFHETKPLELKQIYALIDRIDGEEDNNG